MLDRIGPWLPVLLAMSANSPFWNGVDSGYASYRSQVWQRWPTAGPTGTFGSAAAYRQVIDDLVATGAALDRAMIYFDARLSERYPTLEIRVADVCLRAEDTVLIGALARALVETSAREAADGVGVPDGAAGGAARRRLAGGACRAEGSAGASAPPHPGARRARPCGP